MTPTDPQALGKLMTWYQSMCDGDWEHQHGIHITTLDNPGWALEVDLRETPQEDRTLSQRMTERSPDDWVFVEATGGFFRARGGPLNLAEMVSLFLDFTDGP